MFRYYNDPLSLNSRSRSNTLVTAYTTDVTDFTVIRQRIDINNNTRKNLTKI